MTSKPGAKESQPSLERGRAKQSPKIKAKAIGKLQRFKAKRGQ
jgi:hypothetical protein